MDKCTIGRAEYPRAQRSDSVRVGNSLWRDAAFAYVGPARVKNQCL